MEEIIKELREVAERCDLDDNYDINDAAEDVREIVGRLEKVVAENATTTIKTIEIGYFVEYWNEEYKKWDRQNIVFSKCQDVHDHVKELKFRKGTPYRITKDTRIIEAVCYSDNWAQLPYEK